MNLREFVEVMLRMACAVMDEVLIANLSPTKAQLHGCVFKSFCFHILVFSTRSNLVCVFKCLRFHNRLHFHVNGR